MDADYGVELGPTSPALELPWKDPEGRVHYVELRGGMERDFAAGVDRGVNCGVDRITEARQFPALRRFLVDVNSPRSPWQTAKCDVWTCAVEAAENLYNQGFAQSSYVDVVLAEKAAGLRGQLEAHLRLATELVQLLETDEGLEATAEVVVRRCYFHRGDEAEESDAGYCLTLWLTGYGASAAEADGRWARALELAADCLLKLRLPEARAHGHKLG